MTGKAMSLKAKIRNFDFTGCISEKTVVYYR